MDAANDTGEGCISEKGLELFQIVDAAQQAADIILAHYNPIVTAD